MESTLIMCEAGVLTVVACQVEGGDAEEAGECGWNPEEGRYTCGGSGLDPSLKYSIECPASSPQDVTIQDTLLPESCQDVPFAGCCLGDMVYWCDGAGLHSIDCASKPPPYDQCGWSVAKGYYDCGGIGQDPTGEYGFYCPNIEPDVKTDSAETQFCKHGTLVEFGCQDIPWEGCCNEEGVLFFCEKGKHLCKLDCPQLLPPSDTCGWHAGPTGYYDCGEEGPDPSGTFPLICPPMVIEPDAGAKDNVVPQPVCPGIPEGGCCDGSLLLWCEANGVRIFDCALLAEDEIFNAYIYCGTHPTTKNADCLKKPDPSPPECKTVSPEQPTKPEIVEIVDLWGEILEVLQQDSAADSPLNDGSTGTDVDWGDRHGLVIPVEAEPEPPRESDGCASGASPSSGASVLLAFLAILLLCCTMRRYN